MNKILLSGVFSGLTYGLIMMGFDYYDNQAISINKFILHTVCFGTIMGFSTWYSIKKKEKEEKRKQDKGES